MPIANCVVSARLWESVELVTDPVTLWAERASQDPSQMSINVSVAEAQFGSAYAVVATLLVPDSWSAAGLASLQSGLASTLATCFAVPAGDIIVCTSVLSSGHIVEGGEPVTW